MAIYCLTGKVALHFTLNQHICGSKDEFSGTPRLPSRSLCGFRLEINKGLATAMSRFLAGHLAEEACRPEPPHPALPRLRGCHPLSQGGEGCSLVILFRAANTGSGIGVSGKAKSCERIKRPNPSGAETQSKFISFQTRCLGMSVARKMGFQQPARLAPKDPILEENSTPSLPLFSRAQALRSGLPPKEHGT